MGDHVCILAQTVIRMRDVDRMVFEVKWRATSGLRYVLSPLLFWIVTDVITKEL